MHHGLRVSSTIFASVVHLPRQLEAIFSHNGPDT